MTQSVDQKNSGH